MKKILSIVLVIIMVVSFVGCTNKNGNESSSSSDNSVSSSSSILDSDDSIRDTRTYYYTRTGEKYHMINPCGNGVYYPCTLEEAIDRGLEPCDKCVN